MECGFIIFVIEFLKISNRDYRREEIIKVIIKNFIYIFRLKELFKRKKCIKIIFRNI